MMVQNLAWRAGLSKRSWPRSMAVVSLSPGLGKKYVGGNRLGLL